MKGDELQANWNGLSEEKTNMLYNRSSKSFAEHHRSNPASQLTCLIPTVIANHCPSLQYK